jgi:hypothetical protein
MDISSELFHIFETALTAFLYLLIYATYYSLLGLTALFAGWMAWAQLFGDFAGVWGFFMMCSFTLTAWLYESALQFPNGLTLDLASHGIVLFRTLLESLLVFGMITASICFIVFVVNKFGDQDSGRVIEQQAVSKS